MLNVECFAASRHRLIFLASVPLLISLAGCVRFEPRPISATEKLDLLEARTLQDAHLRTFLEKNLGRQFPEWPVKTWDFDTLTLAAFYFHPSLDLARSQWSVAQAGVITAGGRPNPTVSVTPEYNFNAASGVSPWLPAVQFDLPIETAGKRGHRIAKAQHLSDAARLNLASAAWQLRSNLRQRLLEFTAASRKENLLSRQQATQDKIIQSLEQRLVAGAISRAEITPLIILREKARLDLSQARQQIAEARVGVAEALGLPASSLEDFDLSLDLSMFPRWSGELLSPVARRQALQSRSDILGALAEYAAAQSALQLEIAKQYPDVHLGTGYQWDQGENKWALGLSAEIPVLNRNQGPITEAEAHRSEAAARFATLQAKVIADIDRAAAGYRVARENLAGVATLLDGQQKLRETAEAQLRAGAADQLELLNVQLELGAGELTRLDGQVKAQQAAAALEDAVQRPFDFSGGRNSAASLIDIVGSAPEASVVPLAKETAVKPDPPKP